MRLRIIESIGTNRAAVALVASVAMLAACDREPDPEPEVVEPTDREVEPRESTPRADDEQPGVAVAPETTPVPEDDSDDEPADEPVDDEPADVPDEEPEQRTDEDDEETDEPANEDDDADEPDQPNEGSMAREDLVEPAQKIAARHAEPIGVMPPPPLHPYFADTGVDLVVEGPEFSVSEHFADDEKLSDCLRRARRAGTPELLDQHLEDDDHPCRPLAQIHEQLTAPPAHQNTEPECDDRCCEFDSEGGQFETLNIDEACFEPGEAQPKVTELHLEYHPADDASRDLWARTEAFLGAVGTANSEGDTDQLWNHLERDSTLEVTMIHPGSIQQRVEKQRQDHTNPVPNETLPTERIATDQLVDCVLRGESVTEAELRNCELPEPLDEWAEGITDAETWNWNWLGPMYRAVQDCRDRCCATPHTRASKSRTGVTGVCFDDSSPPRIERVILADSGRA